MQVSANTNVGNISSHFSGQAVFSHRVPITPGSPLNVQYSRTFLYCGLQSERNNGYFKITKRISQYFGVKDTSNINFSNDTDEGSSCLCF